MSASYDATSDALFLRLAEGAVVESEEVGAGVVLDYDARGRVVALELLDARAKLSPEVIAALAAAQG